MSNQLPRRRLLGIAGAVAIAGCLDSADPTESDDETDDADDESPAETTNDDSGTDDENTDDGGNDEDAASDESDEPDEDEDAIHEEYETTEVQVVSEDGDELGAVTAAIADTDELRVLGLSDTDELPDDRGMLFVYDEPNDRTFGMPNMEFGIDIVFADEDGEITEIHHAPEPDSDEDGSQQHYPGRGQYVLEVVYEWTAEHDVSEGDVLEFDLDE